MNKTVSALILSILIVVSMASLISAYTIITGTIYNHDYTDKVEGAQVTVSCDHGDETPAVKEYISLDDGSYGVDFNEDDCEYGDTLTVSAYHEDYGYGSNTGTIHDNAISGNWDFALVDVPLVPEFGMIVGGLTVVSAICVFFFIRRK